MHKISGNGVDTAWVRQYGSGLIPAGPSDAAATAVDAFGNVYVTGSNHYDYATIKYNSYGDTLWVRRYNGPGNCEASSLAIDGSGNVYVTGYSVGSGTSSDYTTIKYNSIGDTLWVRRYNGPGNSNDDASSLAVDGSGNVYVSGTSYGSGSSNDYATIKYNSNGETLWVRRYNGPGNSGDGASALAVDESGNVFVTGESYGSSSFTDYATIKYNSNGDTLWVRRYNGQGNSYDRASSLAVDGSGNVYVTGYSVGSGISSDYATIKYNSYGETLWVRRYNGPENGGDVARSLAVDGNGNVYVTGGSSGSDTTSVYTTIKYNSNGDTLWVRRYNGPGNSGDWASSLAVDGSGNVYVTGWSDGSGTSSDYATIKYNSIGDTLWVRRYNDPINGYDGASSLAVDGNGNVYVTGSSSGDYGTIKYNSSGDTLWVRRYNSARRNSADFAKALAVDDNGNVYVTGSGGTIKYSSDGHQLWLGIYAGIALAVDAAGNVYVTGSRYNGKWNYATIKYNSNGDTLWVRIYNGTGNSNDYASSLAVDGSGNVYVTGRSYGSGTSFYVTIKYNSNGDTLWARRYNGAGIYGGGASSLAVDGSGNVYVTGTSDGSGSSNDYATIKYNSNGDSLWVRRYNGPGNINDGASSLAVDGSGNVYVTGTSYGSGTSDDYATIKYNSNGDTLWVRRYNGPAGYGEDRASSLAVDGNGNVYVTGTSSSDYATIKYNSNGDSLWVRRYNGSKDYYYMGVNFLAVDGSGHVYMTGSIDGSYLDYATVKYSSAGNEEWVARYSTIFFDIPCGICVDKQGNVYVAGSSIQINHELPLSATSFDTPDYSVYTTIKYVQSLTGEVREISNAIPSSFALEQNYPNPFNPTTTIRYALPSFAQVRLTIHDILGREIAMLVNEEQSAGWKEVQWNAQNFASGIYLVRMICGNLTETKKIMMMK